METSRTTAYPAGDALFLRLGPTRCPRVLVVDDERQIVEFLAALLEDEGFEVQRAYDGEEAWERANREHPDLVISDVSMPRLDGMALLNRIRAARALHDTPVILMSAAERTVPRNGAGFVAKPFDLDGMLTLVRFAIGPHDGAVRGVPSPSS